MPDDTRSSGNSELGQFDNVSDLWDEIYRVVTLVDTSSHDEMGIHPGEGLAHVAELIVTHAHLVPTRMEALHRALPAIGIFIPEEATGGR